MKYIKRLIATLLSLTMLIPCVFAAEIYDVEDKKLLEAIQELEGFGLVEIYKDNSFRGFEKVTRRDMAIYISKMLAYDGGGAANYRDVPADDKGYNAIGFVASKNIMVGNGEGRFRPDEYITCAEAVKTVVSALGFDVLAQTYGGYPNGYIKVASEFDLPVNFNTNEYITKSELVLLLRAAYYAPICTMKLTLGDAKYVVDEDVTVLSYYHNTKKYKGIVTGTYLSGLNYVRKGALAEGEIEIDGYNFDTALKNTEDLLGCYVEYSVKDTDDDPEVVSIKKLDKNKEVTAICYDILPETTKTQLCINVNDRKKTYKISENADFIYNREADPAFDGRNMIPENGQIRILDNNNDGIYDVVFIDNYETVIVERISASNMTIENKYANSVGIALDLSEQADYDFIEYEMDGAPAQFSDIAVGNVLSVLKAKQKTSILVKICRKTTSGVFGSYDEEYLSLKDGDKYRVSAALDNAWQMGDIPQTQLGVDVNIYFDFYGNVVYVVALSGIEGYGFLRKVRYIEEEDEATLRILSLATESWDTYKCSEKIRINNVKPNELSNIKSILNDGQLVRFKTNSKGEVTKVETATVYANPGNGNEIIEDKFRATNQVTLRYRTQNNSWNSQYYMDDNTKILYVPTNADYVENESFYKFITASYFTPDRDYNIQGFDYDYENFFKVAIHRGAAQAIQNVETAALAVVCKIIDALNDDDEVVKKLTCLLLGKEYEFYTQYASNNILDGIEKGDILQLGTDEDGKISYVQKIYDYSSGFNTNTAAIGDYHVNRIIVKADVLKVGPRTIRIRTQARDYVFKRNGTVVICDMSGGEIRQGNFNDIEQGDYVVIKYGVSNMHNTVVYKR